MFIELHKKTLKSRIISDVQTVKTHAQHLIIISKDSCAYTENAGGKLGVLAIVGSAYSPIHGEFDQALLCEIGIGRVRPYGLAELPKGNTENHHANSIKARKKLFEMTQEQYELAAPIIFSLIQKIAARKIIAWQCNHNNPFILQTTRNRWASGKRTLSQYNARQEKSNGTRFSISTTESPLIEDVLWAELFGNKRLAHQLWGLAKALSFPLNHYLRLKTQKSLRDLPKYPEIQHIHDISPYPKYLKIRMLEYLPLMLRNYFRDDLFDLVGWCGGKTPEELCALRALPHPKRRLAGIELRLTHDHASPHIKVIEVYPSADHFPATEISLPAENNSMEKDDLPF